MTREEQLEEWVEGNSKHNHILGLCCPDYSCCIPKLQAPRAARLRFQQAMLEGDARTVDDMIDFWTLAMEES